MINSLALSGFENRGGMIRKAVSDVKAVLVLQEQDWIPTFSHADSLNAIDPGRYHLRRIELYRSLHRDREFGMEAIG